MKIFIRGRSIDLTQMSRSEILSLKSQLESERKDIENQLLTPTRMGPMRVKRAKEAYKIKGHQIYLINEYLRR